MPVEPGRSPLLSEAQAFVTIRLAREFKKTSIRRGDVKIRGIPPSTTVITTSKHFQPVRYKDREAQYPSKLHTKRNSKGYTLPVNTITYLHPPTTLKQCPTTKSPPSTSSAPPSSILPTAGTHLHHPQRHPRKLQMPVGRETPTSTGSSASPLTMRWRTS